MNQHKTTTHKTIGNLLNAAVPTAHEQATIKEIEEQLIEHAKQFDILDYIYIVNDSKKLVGVLSVLEVFRQPKNTNISEIMHRTLITIQPHERPEIAAKKALQHAITAIPVVDTEGTLLGIISHNTILHILNKKINKELLRMSSVHNPQAVVDNILQLSVWQSFKHRFPWLLIGLLGGMLAAKIVGAFETTLEEHILLAAFIPLIVYMADAAQTQMETFLIRDVAMTEKFNFKKYFLKQFAVVLLIGIVSSLILAAISLILQNGIAISTVLATSLFAAMISSLFTGLVIPYAVNTFHADPANASGPIATIIQDIASVLIYFSIATWLL